MQVREATAEIEATTGTVVQVFTDRHRRRQVFLLSQSVPADRGAGIDEAINPNAKGLWNAGLDRKKSGNRLLLEVGTVPALILTVPCSSK